MNQAGMHASGSISSCRKRGRRIRGKGHGSEWGKNRTGEESAKTPKGKGQQREVVRIYRICAAVQ